MNPSSDPPSGTEAVRPAIGPAPGRYIPWAGGAR